MGVEHDPSWYAWVEQDEDDNTNDPSSTRKKKKKKKNKNKKKKKKKQNETTIQQEDARIQAILSDPSDLYSDEDDGINFQLVDVPPSYDFNSLETKSHMPIHKIVRMLDPKYHDDVLDSNPDDEEHTNLIQNPNPDLVPFEEEDTNSHMNESSLDMYATRDILAGEILVLDRNTMAKKPEWFTTILKLYTSKKNNL
ncbi:MAG: hypothetical protein ACTSUE_19255 [Promethearchaeota archaeon]